MEDVRRAMRTAAAGPMECILTHTTRGAVSTDLQTSALFSIIDETACNRVNDKFARIPLKFNGGGGTRHGRASLRASLGVQGVRDAAAWLADCFFSLRHMSSFIYGTHLNLISSASNRRAQKTMTMAQLKSKRAITTTMTNTHLLPISNDDADHLHTRKHWCHNPVSSHDESDT